MNDILQEASNKCTNYGQKKGKHNKIDQTLAVLLVFGFGLHTKEARDITL